MEGDPTLRGLGENGEKLEENIYRTLIDKIIMHGVTYTIARLLV